MTAYLIIGGILLLLVVVSCFVAYFRGKRVGAATAKPNVTQYDTKAADEVKKQIEAANVELEKVKVQIQEREAELQAALNLKGEAERLKALADLANKWSPKP